MPGSNDYYSDAAAPAAATPPEDKEPAAPQEEGSDSQTAELPKAILGGKEFKPGEEVVLQVVQVNEDSVLVKYASEKGDEEEPQTTEQSAAPAPAPGGGGGGMAAMMG